MPETKTAMPRFALKQLNPMAALDERAAELKRQRQELSRDVAHFRASAPFVVLGPDGEGSPAGLGRYYHVTSREANVIGMGPETAGGAFFQEAAVVPTHDGSGPVYQNEPEYVVNLPKKGAIKVTPQMVANKVAGTMQNGLGFICITLWEEGSPTFTATYASNGRQVLCVRTTDAARQPVEHPAVLDPEGWRVRAAEAIAAAREDRRAAAAAPPPAAVPA
jgi:hypothetical protein